MTMHADTKCHDLLQRMSWKVEREFSRQGVLTDTLWLAADPQGERWIVQAPCAAPAGLTDSEIFAALKAEQWDDFRAERVTAFAVAFAAKAYIIERLSILHLDGKRTRRNVIAIEAHARDVHLVSHHEINGRCLMPMAPIEQAIGCWGELL